MKQDENPPKMVAPMNIRRRRIRRLQHLTPADAVVRLNGTNDTRPAKCFGEELQNMEPDAERRLMFVSL